MNFSFKNTSFKQFSLEQLRSIKPIIIKKYLFSIIIGIVGLIFFGYGLIVLLSSNKSNDEIEYRQAISSQASENKRDIVVDVSGAVVNPGVYHLGFDARVQDGLIKAGGLSSEANRQWAQKNLNLAAKLSDGGKIYIPYTQESIKGTASTTGTTGIKGDSSLVQNSFININTASSEELDSLPSVGLVTAQKIIQNRPYSAIEDLLSKKVVSSKIFEKIKGKISVY